MKKNSICSDFLTLLHVPHTACFTDRRFENSPYAGTLTGFADILDEYDIATEIRRVADKTALDTLKAPFVAMLMGKMVIVTAIGHDNVTISDGGKISTLSRAEFAKKWNGKALFATPTPTSAEPSYANHNKIRIMSIVRRWGILLCLAILVGWLIVSQRLYRDPGIFLVAIFDLIGIYICYMLLGKQLHISSNTADAVCGFLQKNGCGSIMSRSVSKIFGLIGWGEVGMAYFSVSFIALVAAPEALPYLALFNAFCLPYTVWSISYQKFVAHTWCTLCVIVQTLQWLLFGSYLLAGAWSALTWPIGIGFFALGFGYLLALLVIDRVLPIVGAAHDGTQTAARYDALRLRPDVFALEQQGQPQTADPDNATSLNFGNSAADESHSVIMYCDPLSAGAPGNRRDLDALMKKGYRVRYVFHLDTLADYSSTGAAPTADTTSSPGAVGNATAVSPAAVSPAESAARAIIALYLRDGAEKTWQTMGEFFDTPRRTASFFDNLGLELDSDAVNAEIARQKSWQTASMLFAAPTVVVGDRFLSDIYHIPDLIYIG